MRFFQRLKTEMLAKAKGYPTDGPLEFSIFVKRCPEENAGWLVLDPKKGVSLHWSYKKATRFPLKPDGKGSPEDWIELIQEDEERYGLYDPYNDLRKPVYSYRMSNDVNIRFPAPRAIQKK